MRKDNIGGTWCVTIKWDNKYLSCDQILKIGNNMTLHIFK